ncbi:T9SS type A sorting domain-containing protein [Longitalea luteola]|uniref:T9SS type A sorting domain-containing protein n=1 Tax=Longitalea luteola TaxID=2812563 RepID=UPI001A967479|nr:T9SS type A sorting domain-containing protein [Longitalea luteola]
MKTIFTVLFGLAVASSLQAQVPILNSYPSARATIYLDFDGQYVTGTSWNWGGPINAQPSGFTTTSMTEIFNRVAEDYRIFNVNITTDSTVYAAAPLKQRMRVIITPTYQWYGSAGGVAMVGSFTWGDNTPCFVFSSLLGNNTKNVAEAASHEAGHTLGLQHQSAYTTACQKTEYNPGTGSGETSWAPIMGVGYYRNITTWHYGTNTYGCNYYQDDMAIISGPVNNFGYRTDDIGNNHMTATSVGFTNTGFTTTGLINSGTDKDVFKFTISNPTYVHLSAVPQNVGSNNSGANLDIKVSLLNDKADTIGQYNPAALVNASLDSNLNSGTYYLVVEGTANAHLVKNESLGYYSISASPISVLPIHRLALSGKTSAGTHNLSWTYEADEAVKHIEIQNSKDGVRYEALAQLSAGTKTFSWKPLTDNAPFYRIRVITAADERSYYSNVITLRDKNDDKAIARIMNTMVTNAIVVNSNNESNYQVLDGTGRLLQRGKLFSGTNNIDITNAQKGMVLLRIQGEAETATWKLIKQ